MSYQKIATNRELWFLPGPSSTIFLHSCTASGKSPSGLRIEQRKQDTMHFRSFFRSLHNFLTEFWTTPSNFRRPIPDADSSNSTKFSFFDLFKVDQDSTLILRNKWAFRVSKYLIFDLSGTAWGSLKNMNFVDFILQDFSNERGESAASYNTRLLAGCCSMRFKLNKYGVWLHRKKIL